MFTADMVSCSGSDPAVISCAVPIATLKAEPYYLEWGVRVYAIVSARNVYGPSLFSD